MVSDDLIRPAAPPFMGRPLLPLAPGVLGLLDDDAHTGQLVLLLVVAEVPGAGDVARFLDRLPRDRFIVVPNVIDPKLAGMLQRRGFHFTDCAYFDVPTREWSSGFVRRVR